MHGAGNEGVKRCKVILSSIPSLFFMRVDVLCPVFNLCSLLMGLSLVVIPYRIYPLNTMKKKDLKYDYGKKNCFYLHL